jgi:hypothetical protein
VDEVVVVVGGARSSACEGERVGPKKNRKPSLPARFQVRPVKQWHRAMEGGGGGDGGGAHAHLNLHKEGQGKKKNLKPSHYGSVLGGSRLQFWGWGVL